MKIAKAWFEQSFGFGLDQVKAWASLLDEALTEDQASITIGPTLFSKIVVLRFIQDYMSETNALVFAKKLPGLPFFSVVNQQYFQVGAGDDVYDMKSGEKLPHSPEDPVLTSFAVNVQEFAINASSSYVRHSVSEEALAGDAARQQTVRA